MWFSELFLCTPSHLTISLSFPCLFSPRYRLLWRESTRPVLHFNEDGEHMVVVFKHACMFEENVKKVLCRNTTFLPSLSTCQDFPRCDLLIVMGTSLQVQPFAGLVGRYCRSSSIFLTTAADHRHSCSINLAVYCSQWDCPALWKIQAWFQQ